MIYVIVGKCCSGKTEARKYLQKKGIWTVEASSYAAELKREVGAETMEDVFAEYPKHVVARRIHADLPGNSAVISGFRTQEELEYIRIVTACRTIAIISSDHERLQRWMKRQDHRGTEEDFWARTKSDDKLGLSRLMAMAELNIENEGNLGKLYEQIDTILSIPMKHKYVVYHDGKGTHLREGNFLTRDIFCEECLQSREQSDLLFHIDEAQISSFVGRLSDAKTINDIDHLMDEVGGEYFADFVKIMLVCPSGNPQNSPAKMIAPNRGLLWMYEELNYSPVIDCRYFDPNLSNVSRLYRILSEENIDILGFSVLNTTFHNDLKLIAKSKELSPHSTIVIGGPTAFSLPADTVLEATPVDYVVIGDGAPALMNLAEMIRRGKKSSERVLLTEYTTEARVAKSDSLPMAGIDIVNTISYAQGLSAVYGSRLPYNCAGVNPLRLKISDNCSGECVFCNVSHHIRRPIDTDILIHEIEQGRHEHDSVEFEDHEFTFHRDRVLELCEEVVRRGLADLPKQACTRTNKVDPEVLRQMKQAGILILNFGIESFDQGVLDFYRKGITEGQIRDALEYTLGAGIKPGINLILFSPIESEQTLRKTLDTTVRYVSRGASLNIVPQVTVSFGDPATEMPEYQKYIKQKAVFYDGMKRPLILPVCMDPEDRIVLRIMEETKRLSSEYSSRMRSKTRIEPSIPVSSLAYIWGLATVLGYDSSFISHIEYLGDRISQAEQELKIWMTA